MTTPDPYIRGWQDAIHRLRATAEAKSGQRAGMSPTEVLLAAANDLETYLASAFGVLRP